MARAKTDVAHRARMSTGGGASTTHSSDEFESWTVYQVAMWLYGLASNSETMPKKLEEIQEMQLSEKYVSAYKRGQTLCQEECQFGDGQTEIWQLQLKEAARMVISRQAHTPFPLRTQTPPCPHFTPPALHLKKTAVSYRQINGALMLALEDEALKELGIKSAISRARLKVLMARPYESESRCFYHFPVINIFYDMFMDEPPPSAALKEMLNLEGLLAALLFSTGIAVPANFEYGELEEARIRLNSEPYNTTSVYIEDGLGDGMVNKLMATLGRLHKCSHGGSCERLAPRPPRAPGLHTSRCDL